MLKTAVENVKNDNKKGVGRMAKQAYLFPHPSIEELCESLNELLVDNPEWVLTNVDIMKHEDGTYTGILDYLEPLEK